MSETQLSMATLGTRERVIQVEVQIVVSAAAAKTSTGTATFDKAFVSTPKIVTDAHVPSAATFLKGNIHVVDISATGITVQAYQTITTDITSGTYNALVNVVGQLSA